MGPGRTVVMVGSCTHVAASIVHCLFLSSVESVISCKYFFLVTVAFCKAGP